MQVLKLSYTNRQTLLLAKDTFSYIVSFAGKVICRTSNIEEAKASYYKQLNN